MPWGWRSHCGRVRQHDGPSLCDMSCAAVRIELCKSSGFSSFRTKRIAALGRHIQSSSLPGWVATSSCPGDTSMKHLEARARACECLVRSRFRCPRCLELMALAAQTHARRCAASSRWTRNTRLGSLGGIWRVMMVSPCWRAFCVALRLTLTTSL